jgi:hypothetical protein
MNLTETCYSRTAIIFTNRIYYKVPISGTLYIFAQMRVIAKGKLRDFWLKHADVEQALKAWYQEISNSVWNHPNDIKAEYPSASILTDNRILLN